MKQKFNLDEHLSVIEAERRDQLSVSEHDDLVLLLRRGPMLVLQAEMLRSINGKLNQLATANLGKVDALHTVAFIQGQISGIRTFFELAKDLLENAAEGEIN